MSSNVDRATAMAQEVIDRGVSWSPDAKWQVVLAEAIGAGLVGLIMLFDIGGAPTVLRLLSIVLIGLALVGAFQVWRGLAAADRPALTAFRAGSGITTGVVVLLATVLAAVTDHVTASMAVALGAGFAVYGLIGFVAPLMGRQAGGRLPILSLVTNGVLVAIGVVLLAAGASGAGTVRSVFTLVGILLILLGVGLGGLTYLLYQRQAGSQAA